MAKAKSATEVIAEIENQAKPVRAWGYLAIVKGERVMSPLTWSTRAEVKEFLEGDFGSCWPVLKAAGFRIVKVTIYEGWAG